MTLRTTESLFEQYGPAYKWLATMTVVMGTLASALSTTMVNVAIPDIMGTFGVGQDQGQWMSTAFIAANTATMLVNAWCVHAFGQRNTYVWAMGLFIVGSLIGGFGNHIDILTFARIMQGAAAGLLAPLAMFTMFRVFPDDQRGKAMGYYGIGVILAPAFGPVIGGILVDVFNWRATFFVAPLFCIFGVVCGMLFLPDREDKGPVRDFDWLGLGLLAAFLSATLIGLTNGQRFGWGSDYILSLLFIGAASAVAFVLWELYTDNALLELRVFKSIGFTAASGVSFLYGAGLLGSTYLIPLFVQTTLGYSPTLAGLLLMPAGLMMSFLFPLAGFASDKIAAHIPIIIGFVIFGGSCVVLFDVDVSTTFFLLAFYIAIGRVGLTLIMPSVSVGAVSSLPPSMLGQASGVVNFMRQLGGSFGVNLISVYLATRIGFHSDHLASTQLPDNSSTTSLLSTIRALYGQMGLPDTAAAAGSLHFLGKVIYAKATLFGFRDAFVVIGIVFFIGIIPALVMGYSRKRPVLPDQP